MESRLSVDSLLTDRAKRKNDEITGMGAETKREKILLLGDMVADVYKRPYF